MYRVLLAIAGLMVSTAAYAYAVGGPPIAYVKSSKMGDEVYLVYPDGTGLTRVYRAPKNGQAAGRVERIALLPGGGEIAMTVNNTQLVRQRYDSRGQPVGSPRSMAVNGICLLGDVDYRPDGTVLVSDGCWSLWAVGPQATSATLLHEADQNIAAAAWMRDGSALFQEGQLGTMSLKRLKPDGTLETIAPTAIFPPHFGMSRTSDEAAHSDSYAYRIIDLTNGTSREGCKPAGWVKLSPGGSEMLYRSSGSVIGSSTLFVQKSNCSGQAFRLATKGAYRALAWRAN